MRQTTLDGFKLGFPKYKIAVKKYNTSEWAYRAIKGIFKSILRVTYDVRIHDEENLHEISSDQGFIMASNHGSIVDAFVMGLMVDSHRVRFVGRQRTLWANPFFGKINDIVGTIPVPESTSHSRSFVPFRARSE